MASKTGENTEMEKLIEWLPRYIPQDDDARGIVHGDFR